MIPILCKNELTGTVSEVTEITDLTIYDRLESALSDNNLLPEVFRYEIGNYTYSTMPIIHYTSSGIDLLDKVDPEYVRSTIYQISRFLEDQTRGYLSYSHSIQYFIGAIKIFSDPKQITSDEITREEQINNVYNLCGLLLEKSQYFKYITDDITMSPKKEMHVNDIFEDLTVAAMAMGKLQERKVVVKNISNINPSLYTYEYFSFIPFCIIENAIKYGPPEGCGIVIEYVVENKLLNISIGSTGIAIPDDEVELVMRPGFRSTTAKRMFISGSGIGLFQASLGAEKMLGGRISFKQNKRHRTIGGIVYANTIATIHIPLTNVVFNEEVMG